MIDAKSIRFYCWLALGVLGFAYGWPFRFTEFESKVVVSPGMKLAPAGTRVLSRTRPGSPLVRMSMRGGVDTFLIGEVLFDVEVALGCGIWGFVGSVPSDYDQPGGSVAVEGEGDLVEAALGLVVDADRDASCRARRRRCRGCERAAAGVGEES